ncbi:MAG: ComEC/Rec2 family competence protein [Polaribacter sp.]|nr:ComEC/Rec2 family competence protein [Polaribacter sp.]
MNRLLNYLPLHFVVLGVLGICFQFFTQLWSFDFLETILQLGCLSLLILIVKNSILRTVISFLFFFLIGVSSVSLNDHRKHDSFYEYHLKDNSTVTLQIHKVLKPGKYNQKYEAKILRVDNKTTTGLVLLNIQKDTLSPLLNVASKLLLKPLFKELVPPLNPHQFNYKSYLFKRGIYHQIYTENKRFIRLKPESMTLFGFSAKLRTQVQEALKIYNFKKSELAVINALLLGQRQAVSKELITDYQRAGAIHILAVSGLHVGIILLILSFLLKPIERIKYGTFFKTFCIVILLWTFAFIAGLSASVVRAVTMFTFLAIGLFFRRKYVIEFSFISSLFFLLLLNPMFLFEVGFQLSYLAVFGILWTQPKIYSIWKPTFKIIDFFWQLCTVSIAAQIGILPLSIYYFQQFPGLFLLSNLVIIPLLGSILIGGVLVIFLALLKVLPQFIADFYGSIISWMNAFVSWVSQQEQFLFKEISISLIAMLCWYIVVFLGVYFAVVKSSKKFIYFLISILLVQSVYLIELNEKKRKKELIIFHKTNFSILGKRIGEQLFLQYDMDNMQLKNEYSIRAYRISEGISLLEKHDFKNYIQFAGKEILLIDSLGVYKISGTKNPIVVLQNSTKINLNRLIQTVQPSKIIADGSNYKREVLHWESTCLKNKIPFHYTGQKGAFILKE